MGYQDFYDEISGGDDNNSGKMRMFRAGVRARFLPYRHLRFESEYEPHPDAPGRDRWLGYEPNRTGHAWLLKHPGPPRPWPSPQPFL